MAGTVDRGRGRDPGRFTGAGYRNRDGIRPRGSSISLLPQRATPERAASDDFPRDCFARPSPSGNIVGGGNSRGQSFQPRAASTRQAAEASFQGDSARDSCPSVSLKTAERVSGASPQAGATYLAVGASPTRARCRSRSRTTIDGPGRESGAVVRDRGPGPVSKVERRVIVPAACSARLTLPKSHRQACFPPWCSLRETANSGRELACPGQALSLRDP